MTNHSASSQSWGGLIEHLGRLAERGEAARGYYFLADGEGGEQFLSFTDLFQRACALAAELRRTTVRGERAILLFPSGLEFLEGFFGCLAAGLVAVPVPTQRPNRP